MKDVNSSSINIFTNMHNIHPVACLFCSPYYEKNVNDLQRVLCCISWFAMFCVNAHMDSFGVLLAQVTMLQTVPQIAT